MQKHDDSARFRRLAWRICYWAYVLVLGLDAIGIVVMVVQPAPPQDASRAIEQAESGDAIAERELTELPAYKLAVDIAEKYSVAVIIEPWCEMAPVWPHRGETSRPIAALEPSIRALLPAERTIKSWRRAALAAKPGGLRPELPAIGQMLVVLHDELSLYPVTFIQRIQLRQIVLSRNVEGRGEEIAAAHADVVNATMRCDAECVAISGREFARSCVHHELFHFFDHWCCNRLLEDDEWTDLNSADFAYGKRRKMRFLAFLSILPRGFVTEYATSAMEEDKAELFALMVASPLLVDQLGRTDEIIRAKVQLLKMRLDKSFPAMAQDFWEAAAARHDEPAAD